MYIYTVYRYFRSSSCWRCRGTSIAYSPHIRQNNTSAFRIYNKPYYIPLSRFSFDMVEILLNNYHCKIIPFAAAISVVTLHFHNPKHCDLEFLCVFNCLNAWPYNEVPKYMKTIFVCKPVMACRSFRVAAINADRQFLSRVGSEGPPLVKDWG